MKKKVVLIILAAGAVAAGIAYGQGVIPKEVVDDFSSKAFTMLEKKTKPQTQKSEDETHAPLITVALVSEEEFVEKVSVTGSLVAREQVMIAPEVEGLRVLRYEAEEGDFVKKGQLLARLESTTLTSSLRQNTAALARADAAIGQANSLIKEAEAVLLEAQAQLKRARPLNKSGYLSGSTYDRREAAARSAKARLRSAHSGLSLAKAEKAQLSARRSEITWRLSRSEIRSPVDGLISRRFVRIGDMATSAKPMFEIVENGNVELDAEIDALNLAKVREGQKASITAGVDSVAGRVRLVSPHVDEATRLGHARILLGRNPALKIGAFARGSIETARSFGLSVPSQAVLYDEDGASVLRVENNKAIKTRIKVGLQTNKNIEVLSGLKHGDLIVAKAGTFLRDGDDIKPIESNVVAGEVTP